MSNPKLYNYFQFVWNVRNNHMVHNIPSSYIFMLVCCFKTDCQRGPLSVPITWYPGGPHVTQIPFPPEHPWRNEECTSCSGFYVSDETSIANLTKPPCTYIKENFSEKNSMSEVN